MNTSPLAIAFRTRTRQHVSSPEMHGNVSLSKAFELHRYRRAGALTFTQRLPAGDENNHSSLRYCFWSWPKWYTVWLRARPSSNLLAKHGAPIPYRWLVISNQPQFAKRPSAQRDVREGEFSPSKYKNTHLLSRISSTTEHVNTYTQTLSFLHNRVSFSFCLFVCFFMNISLSSHSIFSALPCLRYDSGDRLRSYLFCR